MLLIRLIQHQLVPESEQVVSESIKSAKEKKYSKSNPYDAEVLTNINLNGRGSDKETRHIELLLDNFGKNMNQEIV